MKHIKKFNSFEEINEGIFTWVCMGFLLYKFIMAIINNHDRKLDVEHEELRKLISLKYLDVLKSIENVPVVDLADRFFIRIKGVDLRILKKEKVLYIDNKELNIENKVILTDEEYGDFLKLIKK